MTDRITLEAAGCIEINDLVSELERSGIVVTTLGELRQSIAHVDRLGRYVLAMIEQTLSEHGIGYFPETAFSHPAPRQHHEVRLYLRDSEIGRTVEAVLHPSPAGDVFLRGLSALAPEGQRPVTRGILKPLADSRPDGAVLRDHPSNASDDIDKQGM